MYITWLRNRDEISASKADDFRTMYLELAKRMEKEQIKDAYWNGGVNWDEGIDGLTYYKENYEDK
jgi:hypothetical protein